MLGHKNYVQTKFNNPTVARWTIYAKLAELGLKLLIKGLVCMG